MSAVSSGVAQIREVVAKGEPTILFLDEIHRFNKAQQDALLPHVEAGTITLVGATTENPSFEVIAPLLSRAKVVVLDALADADVMSLLRRALADPERGLGKENLEVDEPAIEAVASLASGDARAALSLLDLAVRSKKRPITRAV